MGKPSKKRKQSEDQQVDDVMAWGKSKQNYYQQSEHEYSEASEEQHEAKEIYQNQLNDLNREDYYQVPDQEVLQSEEEEQEQGEISDQYLCREILWVTELAKLFEGIKDEKYQLRKKVYDSYLLILMALKSFKIPYVDQHPLISNLPFLKKALEHFEKQLPALYETNKLDQNLNGTQEGIESEDIEASEEGEQNSEIDQQGQNQNLDYQESEEPQKIQKVQKKQKKNQGLQIYERIRQSKQEERKQKKAENRKAREASRPKQVFRLVGQNEGRLANEKILKNKGLMKRRRRDDGNSRTKLRHKYEKALVRRRAKGPIGVKENPGRFYEGEDKILYGKIASTKLS